MKFLTTIFAFYILVLPFVPCTDSIECNSKENIEILSSANHENHQHQKEDCSPFCSCTCCGHIFGSTQLFNPIVKPVIVAKYQYFYQNICLPSDFFGNIWQPPQLG